MNIKNFLYNYKLIKFNDGTFGVRRGWVDYKFKDFKAILYNFWWYEDDFCFGSCKTDEETARKFLNPIKSFNSINYRTIE